MLKIDGEGEFDTEVVGESFYQETLLEIAGPKTQEEADLSVEAVLIPEPDNPHDRNAVGVYIDGKKVGHLSKSDAAAWVTMLANHKMTGQPVMCDAMITGGWSRDNGRDVGAYGVVLDI